MNDVIRTPHGRLNLPRLGFGGAYLIGGANQKSTQRIVDTAIDAGFRHFDVAPLYGLGTAESALGVAIAGKRDMLSIASKVGLPRPHASRSALLLRRLPPPLRAALRKLIARPAAVGDQPPSNAPIGKFDVPSVVASIEETLRSLGTDYLDLLLLHEVRLEQIDEALLTYLDKARAEGRLRSIGIGAERTSGEQIAAAYPEFFDVYQYSWNVLDQRPSPCTSGAFTITHRAILDPLKKIKEAIGSDHALRGEISNAVGLDIGNDQELTRLLLGAALAANPNGMVLFGTRNFGRIAANAVVMTDPKYQAAGAAFAQFRERFEPASR